MRSQHTRRRRPAFSDADSGTAGSQVTLHHSMCSLYFTGFLLATLLSAATSPARADDWARPQTKEVFSPSREYFVRVIPGESLGDTFGFAREKKGKYAAAEFYRRQQDRSSRR